MHQKKNKKFLVYLFLLFIFSSIGNNYINNFKFDNIQYIKISGLDKKDNNNILKQFKNFNKENIFFIDKTNLNKIIRSNVLVEEYEIFKKYPNTIDIKIKKTKFLAKINTNGKIFLVGSNGKLIPNESGYLDLPFIFGKPNINEFLNFKKIIDKSKFSFTKIEELYFFPSKRWDLKFENNILLKLPNKLSNETLSSVHEFIQNYEGEKFSIVDARIENQIILNE